MFDSLKGGFRNLFKKGKKEEDAPSDAPAAGEPGPPEKKDAVPERTAGAAKDSAPKKEKAPERKKRPAAIEDDDDIDALLDDLLDGKGDDDDYPEDDDDRPDEDDKYADEHVKDTPEPVKTKAQKPARDEAPVTEKRPDAKTPVKTEPVKVVPPEPIKAVPAPAKIEKPAAEKRPDAKTPVKTEPVKVVPPEPVKAVSEPAGTEDAPAKAGEQKLSRKERVRLAKQEKIAAKEKRREKDAGGKEAEEGGQESSELIGDRGKKIKDRKMDDILWALEVALLEADVALPVVEEIKNGVRDDLAGKKYARGHTLDEVIEISLKESISKILRLNEFDFDAWFDAKERPVVIMFVGINGTGKTTAIAKIANRLIKNGKTVVLAASDTFRAGAIEQLTIHSEKLGCRIVKHSADADPAAVAYDAVEHAKAKRKDAVLVDTAGRMQTNSNLMDEMKKIKKVAKPDLVMFVGDSLAGNDAVEQARAFDAAVGIDAIMLTKIDADSKGGAALSIAHTIGRPIAFVSNGQEYDQIVKFSPGWMIGRLFED